MAALRVVNGAFPRTGNRLIDAVVDKVPDLVTMGGLTIISNIYGNPARVDPAGTSTACPWACRCWRRTIVMRSCSTWACWPNASSGGPRSPRRSVVRRSVVRLSLRLLVGELTQQLVAHMGERHLGVVVGRGRDHRGQAGDVALEGHPPPGLAGVLHVQVQAHPLGRLADQSAVEAVEDGHHGGAFVIVEAVAEDQALLDGGVIRSGIVVM